MNSNSEWQNIYWQGHDCCHPIVMPYTTVDSRYLEIKGALKTVRDIRTSTYQICSTEEKDNLNNQILHMTM